MTNEEKTENIISKYETKYNDTSDLLWTDIEDVAMEMAKWKDEQYNEEKKELISLVNMLPVDDHNQTIIEDLIALLR